MRVLITGATGFVGFHAAAALCAAGHEVRALVRDLEKGERVPAPIGVGTADLVQGDMTDEAAIARAIAGCDAVVHAAASVSVTTGATDFQANIVGVQAVVGAAIQRDLPCVYVSSLEAIMELGRPTTETSEPSGGKTHYGRSKSEADRWIRARQAEGARIANVYPSGVVGPDDPGFSESVKAYRSFLRGTLGVGATQFVDGRDLATLIVRLLETGHSGPVIAAGHYLTWTEMTKALRRVTGAEISQINAPGWALRAFARTLDVVARVTGKKMPMTGEGIAIATLWQKVDDSKIVAELGVVWRPVDETLEDLFRWYVKAGRLPVKAVPALAEKKTA